LTNPQIIPDRITKPIQLLAAWLVGLVVIDGAFLTGAAMISEPAWVSGALVVASLVNVPLFLICLFLLQTKFRPEMQEDSYYAPYLEATRSTKLVNSETNELKEVVEKEIKSESEEFEKALKDNNQYEQDKITGRLRERQREKKQLEQAENLIYLATHDPLTRVYNRVGFSKAAEDMIEYARSSSNRLAFLFFDIDSFKPINDQYGHEFGDKLLVASADRLKRVMGDDAILARMGGDEFVSVIEYVERRSLKAILLELVGTMSVPFLIEEKEICISVSIGVSLYPEQGSTTQELLHVSDQAMCQAKKQGKGKYVISL